MFNVVVTYGSFEWLGSDAPSGIPPRNSHFGVFSWQKFGFSGEFIHPNIPLKIVEYLIQEFSSLEVFPGKTLPSVGRFLWLASYQIS